MVGRVLTQRVLNRTLLDRQLLLERAPLPIEDALSRVGGLQTQYAPSGYVGLWTRVAGFRRAHLTRALEERTVVQATLMRTTIHLVARDDFWPFALGIRNARRTWSLRVQGSDERTNEAGAARLRQALADGPRTVKELGDLASGFLGSLSHWVDLVRVPPSGTWERRRADRLALAEAWVGREDATEEEGLRHLVRSYLRAFGPAPWKDIASWAGVPVADLRAVEASLDLARYRDEQGSELLDLAGESIVDGVVTAPVRFLPHWDATLLVHARRTGLLPEEHRSRIFTPRNPFSVGVYLVDGRVVGAWSLRGGHVVLDPYGDLGAADRKAVEMEREALDAFHA